MSEPTDIEKKSLEAHVELCAERYSSLDTRLDHVDAKITSLETIIREVHDMIHAMAEKRNDQIITWGVGVIGTLVAIIAWLVSSYIIK